jgi:hypothetical protein
MWPWALCEGECGGLGASRYLHLVQELHNTAMHSILCARHTCLETEDGQSDDAVGFGPHQHLSLKVPPALQSQTVPSLRLEVPPALESLTVLVEDGWLAARQHRERSLCPTPTICVTASASS